MQAADVAEVVGDRVEHGGIPDRSQADPPSVFNRVQVTVQETDPEIADVDLRWISVGDPLTLIRSSADGVSDWAGTTRLPEVAGPPPPADRGARAGACRGGRPLSVAESVVFVESVELT